MGVSIHNGYELMVHSGDDTVATPVRKFKYSKASPAGHRIPPLASRQVAGLLFSCLARPCKAWGEDTARPLLPPPHRSLASEIPSSRSSTAWCLIW